MSAVRLARGFSGKDKKLSLRDATTVIPDSFF